MIESNAEIRQLILDAQNNVGNSRNTLVKLMQDNGAMRIISRYLYLNKLLEPDDAKSEFWMGVILAIPEVKLDIGDPLQYLIWKGENRVKTVLRKLISENITAICRECHLRFRLYRVGGDYKCRRCGSTSLETHSNVVPMTTMTSHMDEPNEENMGMEKDICLRFRIDMDGFKILLTNQERRVYEAIVQENINRFEVANYIVEISQKMDVSPQCVSIYIKRIREKLKEYMGTK